MDNQDENDQVYTYNINDKIKLCNGVLANITMKEKLKYLKMPIVYIYSKKNCLVNLKHADMIKKV